MVTASALPRAGARPAAATPAPSARDAPSRADALAALAVFTLCLGLYVRTLAPGLIFPVTDSHELTLNALRLGVPHPSGYPLYTWAGFLFIHLLPFGDAAYRMNLMSGVLGAAGAGLVVLVGRRLGLGRLVAAFAALLLGVSTTFWSQSVMAEVYAPDLAMLALVVLLLLRWAAEVRAGGDGQRRFVLFALAFGLSLGTHLSNLGFAPSFALFVLATQPGILRRPGVIALALAAFLLGAAQYVWLPLRGGVFDQYPNTAPVTLTSIWYYTFGAFGSLKFAYPVAALPFRLWFYLGLVAKNFTVAGVALGTLGMWVALWRHPARFWLLFGMLVTNVFVFAQMAVPDPEPFFLAGYLPWVLFIGFALQAALDAATRVAPRRAVAGIAAAGLAVWLAGTARTSWRQNDRSADTLAGDFGPNAFALMPPGSFVVAPRGAFGADMTYWQRAHGLGRDVIVLGQAGAPPRPPGAPLFTTVRVAGGKATPTGRLGQRAEDLPPDAWYVPVLLGNTFGLLLSSVRDTPPPLVVPDAPAERLDQPLGPLTLVAANVTPVADAPSPRLHVESWWRVPTAARFVISTRIGDHTLESHDLGLGNLPRYAAEVGVPDGALVHEAFDVVVPSTLPRGEHAIRLGVTESSPTGLTTHWTEVGHVTIP